MSRRYAVEIGKVMLRSEKQITQADREAALLRLQRDGIKLIDTSDYEVTLELPEN